MLVLIETDLGKITLDVSFAAYIGASQLNWNGGTFDVRLVSKDSLAVSMIGRNGKMVLPVGSVEFVRKAAELLEVKLPEPLNIPDGLKKYVGREMWVSKKSELKELNYPCFVKPLYEVKLFTGFVAKSAKDFELYPELNDWDGELFCSEVVSDIVSEWRCYVLKGKVFNCSCYSGDPLMFPDKNEIQYLVSAYKNAPVGYALDVSVTKTGTKLIECNDAWSLGYYGGDFVDYFKMVKERWLEIFKQSV